MQNNDNVQKAGSDKPKETLPVVSSSEAEQWLKEGNAFINAGKYEEAITKLGEALALAIKGVGNEMDYSLVKYYYAYGDSIIAKLSTSNELFGDAVQEVIAKKGGEILEEIKKEEKPKDDKSQSESKSEEGKSEEQKNEESESESKGEDEDKDEEEDENEVAEPEIIKPKKEEDKNNLEEEKKAPSTTIPTPSLPHAPPPMTKPKAEVEEELADDAQIAWETMETARIISERKRASLESQKDSQEYKDATKMAARIHMSIGEILSMQEKEEEAVQEFIKAMELRTICEDEFSRELAESYFTLGSTIIHNKGKEREAIDYLLKSTRIIEANICKALKIPFQDEERKVGVYYAKPELIKESLFDSKEVKELKEVLSSIYNKIEDAVLQEKELPELNKVIEENKNTEAGPKEAFDKQQFPQDQVVNLGIIKGKKRTQGEPDSKEMLSHKEEPKNGTADIKKPKVDENK